MLRRTDTIEPILSCFEFKSQHEARRAHPLPRVAADDGHNLNHQQRDVHHREAGNHAIDNQPIPPLLSVEIVGGLKAVEERPGADERAVGALR